LELNASDERGIQVIRDKVKTFAQLTASAVRPDGKPCPPFKIIILDEADSMTSSAQAALRRTMEKESKTTRFCLICNYVSRIIEPLSSRCSKFRFKPLSLEILEKRLNEICEKEEVKCDADAMDILIETSEGDLRKAITSLQSAHRLKGSEGITKKDVYEITGVIPTKSIQGILNVCESNSYEKIDDYVKKMIMDGFPAAQILNQLHDVLIASNYSDKQKSTIFEKIAICDHRLLDGADEYLQLMDLCTVMMQTMCH
jgi:replication factor C subunit 2/4